MPTQPHTDIGFPWELLMLGSVISIMVILGLWKLVTAIWTWAGSPSQDSQRLFRKLARLHRLNRDELLILRNLQTNRPAGSPPASLFVDPSSWMNITQEPDQLVPAKQHAKRALFQKLFGFEIDRYQST